MAATDVLAATPAASPPWTSFDDFLDFQTGTPTASPRLAPSSTSVAGPSTSALAASTPSQVLAEQAAGEPQAGVPASTATPPPPGSSPETLFRYYLTIELRKIGSNADDAIIDRYVAQHYGSFTRAMERQQAQQQQQQQQRQSPLADTASLGAAVSLPQDGDMTAVSTANAFKSPPPMLSPSSAPYLLQGTAAPAVIEGSLPASFNPTAMHLPSQPSYSAEQDVKPVMTMAAQEASIPLQAASPSTASRSHRSEDAMSEDDNDEDDEDESKDDIKDLPSRSRKAAATEEVPIAGSIMGPSNELRPDPETYRNLTSKEKRQLRNKISARNFRTRRKEHISHLEQQVADRDTLIEGLRQQLAQVNLKNKELTDEVRQLKSKPISPVDMQRLIEALQKTGMMGSAQASSGSESETPTPSQQPMLARTASSSSLNDSTSVSRPMSPRPASGSGVTRPNTRKDVPATQGGATGTHSFWGGAMGGTAWPVNPSQAVA